MTLERAKKYKTAIRIGLISCVSLYFMVAIHYGYFNILALSENRTNTDVTPIYLTDKID